MVISIQGTRLYNLEPHVLSTKIQIFLISTLLVSSLDHFQTSVLQTFIKVSSKFWHEIMSGVETFKASRWPLTFCLSSWSFKIIWTILILFSSAERSCLLVKKQNIWVVLFLLILNLVPVPQVVSLPLLILNIVAKSFCVVPGIFLKPLLILSFSLDGIILTGLWYSFVFVLGYVFLLPSFIHDLLKYKWIKSFPGSLTVGSGYHLILSLSPQKQCYCLSTSKEGKGGQQTSH